MQYSAVMALEREQKQFQRVVDTESQHISTKKKLASEAEAKVLELEKKEVVGSAALRLVEQELDAVRKKLVEVESKYEKKVEEGEKIKNDIRSNRQRIVDLRADMERSAEALTLGEKSLKIARGQVGDARKLLNPLRHPRVKQLLGTK